MKKFFVFVLCTLFSFSVFAAETIATENVYMLDSVDVQYAMSNPDFMVTAGDIYTLAYGAAGSAVQYTIVVDSTYKVRVSNLSVIDASGKSFLELKKQVEDIVTKNYPLSGAQFVLTKPGTFTVTIKGEVKAATERRAWALTRLSDVLSGSLTSFSSTRNVVVTSANGKIKTYDLFKVTRDADFSQNPYLRPGDVISIKRAERIVSISGEVERGGTYQLLAKENLKTLIDYYGHGLLTGADISRIQVTRYDDDQNKEGRKIYLDLTDGSDFELTDLDAISIPSFKTQKPVMFLEGAIGSNAPASPDVSARWPIQYEIGTSYIDIVRSHRSSFTEVSDISNAYIVRNSQIIPIDISKILYDSSNATELLVEPYDVLRIPFKQYFISVAGSVRNPGRYPYIPDRTWEYYIGLAGGFIKTENKRKSITIVDINGKELSKNDVITPETTITAETNSGIYYFNLYAPVVTTVLSLITTTISVLAIFGIFNR